MSLDAGVDTGLGASVDTASQSQNGGNGIQTITSPDGSVTVTNPTGPTTNLKVATSAAAWTISTTRFFAVDDQAGSDSNAGFSDVSMAAAGLVAKKTIGALTAIFPRIGQNRIAVVAIRARAGNAQYADALDFLQGAEGYNQLCIYGTDTNATASAVAFAGDIADTTYAGAQMMPGANAAGYKATGSPSTSSCQLILFAGGDPGFLGEPNLPLGARFRWDSATPTAALRNVCRLVRKVVGTDTIMPESLWPAVPSAGNDFGYLEVPGVLVAASTKLSMRSQGLATQIAGIDFSNAISNWRDVDANFSFCHFRSSLNQQRGAHFWNDFYTHPVTGTPVASGNVIDGADGYNPSNLDECILDATVVRSGLIKVINCKSLDFQAGSVACAGLYVEGFGEAPATNSATQMIGRRSGNGQTPRIIGPGPAAGLQLFGSRVCIGDIEITGMGALPAIQPVGNCGVWIAGSTLLVGPNGSAGNTGVGLDLSQAQQSQVYTAIQPTVTGSGGDVALADATGCTWSALLAIGTTDTAGNFIGKTPVPKHVATRAALAAVEASTLPVGTMISVDDIGDGFAQTYTLQVDARTADGVLRIAAHNMSGSLWIAGDGVALFRSYISDDVDFKSTVTGHVWFGGEAGGSDLLFMPANLRLLITVYGGGPAVSTAMTWNAGNDSSKTNLVPSGAVPTTTSWNAMTGAGVVAPMYNSVNSGSSSLKTLDTSVKVDITVALAGPTSMKGKFVATGSLIAAATAT